MGSSAETSVDGMARDLSTLEHAKISLQGLSSSDEDKDSVSKS